MSRSIAPKTYRRVMVSLVAFLAALQVPAQSIPETTARLVLADDIERKYIDSLSLQGGSAAAALETLLEQGFRCRIETAGEYAPGESPMWHCIKQPSGYAPPCDELRVSARFTESSKWTTREALLLHLDAIRVQSARASCSTPRRVPAEYLTARDAAETSLRTFVDSLELVGDARGSYGKLLLDGFHCEFAMRAVAQRGPPQMVCTKAPSQIKYCFRAKVSMDIEWADGVNTMKQLYNALLRSQVRAVTASCEIPQFGGGNGQPL